MHDCLRLGASAPQAVYVKQGNLLFLQSKPAAEQHIQGKCCSKPDVQRSADGPSRVSCMRVSAGGCTGCRSPIDTAVLCFLACSQAKGNYRRSQDAGKGVRRERAALRRSLMAKSAKGTAKPPADKPPPAVHDHSKQQQPHSVNGGIDKHKSAKSVKRQAPEGAGTNPAAQQRGGKADKHRKTEHSSKPAERAANKQHGAGEHQQSAKNHHKPGDGNSGQPAAHRPTKGPQKPAAKPQPPAPQQPRKPGSNWEALKTQIGATGAGAAKRKEIDAAAGRKPNSRGSNTGV